MMHHTENNYKLDAVHLQSKYCITQKPKLSK
jgi:hypothetical protein